EVLVLKGEVEAAPHPSEDSQRIVLREKDARRFATSGVSSVHDSEQKFEELRQPVLLDRFVSPVGYARWSFDERDGSIFKAEGFGLAQSPADAVLVSPKPLGESIHTKGRVHGAL